MSSYRFMLNFWNLLERFQLFGTSQITSQNSISFFFLKIQIFGFPCWSTREDLCIGVSITNVGLILTKLRWFQLFVTSQNSNFKLFWKKSNYWVSMCVVPHCLLVKTVCRETDRQTRFWNPHMETCRHTKNFNSKLKISG